jgi:hypothetical protein
MQHYERGLQRRDFVMCIWVYYVHSEYIRDTCILWILYAPFIGILTKKTDSVTLVCKRTIPTERPPLVGEVSEL